MIMAAFLLAGMIIDVTLLHLAMITVTVITITAAICLAMTMMKVCNCPSPVRFL